MKKFLNSYYLLIALILSIIMLDYLMIVLLFLIKLKKNGIRNKFCMITLLLQFSS